MHRIAFAAAAVALVACVEKDTTPPPAPYVDPYDSPTNQLKPVLSGSAEYASTVSVRGAAGGDLTLTADPITGRWWTRVSLAPNATTSLTLTATDLAGNVSDPTQLDLVHDASPKKIALSFLDRNGQPTAQAFAGEPVAVAVTLFDAFGSEVTDTVPAISFAPALAAYTGTAPCTQSSSPLCDPASPAACSRTFIACNVGGVPNGKLTFTVSAGTLSTTGTLKLNPGAAQQFRANAFEWAPAGSGASKSVSAGASADYLYAVTDVYGNATVGPVSIATNAPGAVILDDGVSGKGTLTNLSYTGSYTVTGFIAGVGEAGRLNVTVGTGPGATMSVTASTQLASPSSDVKVFAVVRDAYNNLAACSASTLSRVTWAAQGSAGGGAVAPVMGSVGCVNGQYGATFRFTTQDTWAITGTYTDGTVAPPVALNNTAYVQVLFFDTTPPTVDIPQATLRVNGTPCVFAGTPPVCNATPGDFIEFNVVANDNASLSEVSYTAFFATAGGAGTLRARAVLVAANAPLPLTQPFSFTVPGATFLEDVPLTALAIDGAGNRATSVQLLLRVNFGVFAGRTATVVARDTGAGVLRAPEDVAVDAAGNVYVANGGNNNVLRIPAGSSAPVVYATAASLQGLVGGFSPGFIALDGAGNLYVTDRGGSPDILRIDTATPPGVTDWVRYTDGAASVRGLALTQPSVAKGLVTFSTATPPLDGDRLTLGTVTYEIDNVGGCAGGNTCVPVTTLTQAAAATALAGCIAGGTGCTPGVAHPAVTATAAAAPAPVQLVLAARMTGTAGNAIALTTTAAPRLTVSRATLAEGRDASMFAGEEGGGTGTRSFVYRFSASMTPGMNENANVGAFDMFSGATGFHEQWGVAVKDLGSATTRNLRDFVFYFPDVTTGQDRLRGARFTDVGPATAVFNTPGGGRPACADCIRGTNDAATPIRTFNTLWDVALEPVAQLAPIATPEGCLLVSDDGNGDIYVVDTRDPTAANPLVSVVATGTAGPRGLAFDASGNLYVALRGANAIVKVSPSPSATDCF